MNERLSSTKRQTNEIHIFREAKKVFGNARKEKKRGRRKRKKEIFFLTVYVWFTKLPPKSSVIKHKNHPNQFHFQ
jgi:hypothetical protein